MGRQRTDLTQLEWVLMDALWTAGRATATDLQQILADSQAWAYSTVKTMLDRLVEMGFVKARRVAHVYEYSPARRRPTVVRRVVDDLTDRLFSGSAAPFIQCLIEQRTLTREEIAQLRRLLDNYDADPERPT